MINWKTLATEVGALVEGQERGSSALARLALEKILGEQELREAVDHYIAFKPGFELVRSVLGEIQPWSAMAYCYELYQHSPDIEIRRSAIELLRVIADKRVLVWLNEFMDDADEGIQTWGGAYWTSCSGRSLWSQMKQNHTSHVRRDTRIQRCANALVSCASTSRSVTMKMSNNSINSDAQLGCAPLGAGYAGR